MNLYQRNNNIFYINSLRARTISYSLDPWKYLLKCLSVFIKWVMENYLIWITLLFPGSSLTVPFTKDRVALSTSEPLHWLFLSLQYSSFSSCSSWFKRHFSPRRHTPIFLCKFQLLSILTSLVAPLIVPITIRMTRWCCLHKLYENTLYDWFSATCLGPSIVPSS